MEKTVKVENKPSKEDNIGAIAFVIGLLLVALVAAAFYTSDLPFSAKLGITGFAFVIAGVLFVRGQ